MSLSPDAQLWRARGRVVRVRALDVFSVSANDAANGVPLVLLHGFPSSSFDFHRCWDALARGRRVVALDLPGFGFSSKPADYAYSLFEQADAVEVVLRTLGIARADLLAHDMGTSVATELLARREAGLLGFDVERLVLMNGSVHLELAQLTPSQKLLRLPALGPLLARLSSRTVFRAQLRRILARPVAPAELDDMFALLRLRDGHLRLPAIIRYLDERERFARRWIGALERLDRPSLVLWGAKDPVAVIAIARQLARETPGAALVTMDDLGHYPQLEDPSRVAAEVCRFLDAGR
jgi:pimeloyl-ACP methyl ester carboxylesterase